MGIKKEWLNSVLQAVRSYIVNSQMQIFKEKRGIISQNRVWVAIDNQYLYTADTLRKLLWLLITDWKHDRHLAG